MSDLKFRPRFKIETSLEEDEVSKLVKDKLKLDNPHGFESMIIKDHLILKINQNKKHFWSPQLDASLSRPDDDKGTLIRCLLAPEPGVWTMFMFFYTASGIGAFAGLMIMMTQWTLDREMWGAWVAILSLLFGVVLFLIAQFGKGIAHDEMKLLKAFFTDINFPQKKA